MYKFNHDASTIDIYFKLLQEFSKNDFVMNGGSFDLGFSQKIENRKPGTIGGIQGTLKWSQGLNVWNPMT